MSLSKILASAQKLGMPVVITDREGHDAQVVMPFDDFVALTNSVTGEAKRGASSGTLDDLNLDHFTDVLPSDSPEFSLSDLDNELQSEMSRAEHHASDFGKADLFSSTPSLGKDEKIIGMEEKFYLEPLEGEESR